METKNIKEKIWIHNEKIFFVSVRTNFAGYCSLSHAGVLKLTNEIVPRTLRKAQNQNNLVDSQN